jgi:hypothetical protein
MLIAYDYYSKAHNYIAGAIGTPRFGVLKDLLERITDSVATDEID